MTPFLKGWVGCDKENFCAEFENTALVGRFPPFMRIRDVLRAAILVGRDEWVTIHFGGKVFGIIAAAVGEQTPLIVNIYLPFSFVVNVFFARAATGVRDENLKAGLWLGRKRQGGSEATTRSILDVSAQAI